MENHGQKRSADEQFDALDGVQALLFGVEGTTTPVTFATEKLLPYMRENAKSYLETHYDEEECQSDLDALREQSSAGEDGATVIPAGTEDNKEAVIEAAVNFLTNMLDSRCMSNALNAHMMREAYKTGLIQGELYGDVVPALRSFLDSGLKAYTLSSTSSEAQRLLFGYSDQGNASELFSGFFDSSMGARDDKETFTKVAEAVGVKSEEIMFVTNTEAEARAAGEAGLRTAIVMREGADIGEEARQKFNTIGSLLELTGASDFPEAKRLDGQEDGVVDDEDDEDDDDDDVDDVDDDVVDQEGDDVGDEDAEEGSDDA